MANVFIQEETMHDIADAIRARRGSVDLYKPADMAGEIMQIPSGGSGGGFGDYQKIRFYDLDGTVLHSFSVDEIQGMESLPELPGHEGMACQGWNWTLEELKAAGRPMKVGAVYITDDGATRIYLRLKSRGMKIFLGFSQSYTKGVTVDWGDGSEMEKPEKSGTSSAVNLGHTYQGDGNYVVRLIPSEEVVLCLFSSSRGAPLVHAGFTDNNPNRAVCNMVEKIEIGRNVTLGAYAFANMQHLESVNLPENIVIKDYDQFYYCTTIKALIIPRSAERLANYFATNCYGLEHLVFPATMKSVVNSAFSSSHNLKEITLPDGFEKLGDSVFSNCSKLEQVLLPEGMTEMGNSAFKFCYGLREMILPESLTVFDTSPFASCYSLAKISLSSQMTELPNSIFGSCSGLKEVQIPPGVTAVRKSAFDGCTILSGIELPENVELIAERAFYGCYALDRIVIPGKVRTIEASAFTYCYSLREIVLLPEVPPALANVNAFTSVRSDFKICVPKGCLGAYQEAENWSQFASNMVEIED